jgi:hypothetical protein
MEKQEFFAVVDENNTIMAECDSWEEIATPLVFVEPDMARKEASEFYDRFEKTHAFPIERKVLRVVKLTLEEINSDVKIGELVMVSLPVRKGVFHMTPFLAVVVEKLEDETYRVRDEHGDIYTVLASQIERERATGPV